MQLFYFLTDAFDDIKEVKPRRKVTGKLWHEGKKFVIISPVAVQGRFTASDINTVKKLQRAYAQVATRLQENNGHQPTRTLNAYEISREGKYIQIKVNGEPVDKLPRIFLKDSVSERNGAEAQAIANMLREVATALEKLSNGD